MGVIFHRCIISIPCYRENADTLHGCLWSIAVAARGMAYSGPTRMTTDVILVGEYGDDMFATDYGRGTIDDLLAEDFKHITVSTIRGKFRPGGPARAPRLGMARDKGFAHMLGNTPTGMRRYNMLMTTDADCTVPDTWIYMHHGHLSANGKCAASIGSVQLPKSSSRFNAFEEAREAGKLDNAVFEQNMAFSGEAYNCVSGFSHGHTAGEGLDLLGKMTRGGWYTVRSTTPVVTTSDRDSDRVPNGFGSMVQRL